jgi:hypothetical protein
MNHAIARWLASGLLAALVAGCVTDDREPLGWQCIRQIADGDVIALSNRSLSVDGRARGFYHRWEWRHKSDGLIVREEETDSFSAQDLASQLQVFVDVPGRVRHRISGVGISFDAGRTWLDPRLEGQEPHQSRYEIRVPVETVLSLAGKEHPPVVIGYDRAGRLLLRAPIDVDAIRRGREAMGQASEATADMVRNYESACRRDKRSYDAIIIT